MGASQAFLVDAAWPEFESYVLQQRRKSDVLAIPHQSLAGDTRWRADGFGTVHASSLLGYLRSRELLDAAHLPGSQVRTRFKYDDLLARSYAFLLGNGISHVTVAQNLLPFLWRAGVLLGRTFDVLMVRLPLHVLQARLDAALHRHPLGLTLAAYRADSSVVDAEQQALACAQRLITPHSEVARLVGDRALKLPWSMPARPRWSNGRRVVLAGDDDARHGSYTLRDVARAARLPVCTLTNPGEYISFWRGVDVVQRDVGGYWLHDVKAVALPAWTCNQPRALLSAVVAGVPVVASTACGLAGMPHVTEVPVGDDGAFSRALLAVMKP
jgi:hypothetical protein